MMEKVCFLHLVLIWMILELPFLLIMLSLLLRQPFQSLSAPHSLALNLDKTKALITLDPNVVPSNPALTSTLALLKPSNCLTQGTVYLGMPIG